jgi:coniferyl-aldehyde dehydrogenase
MADNLYSSAYDQDQVDKLDKIFEDQKVKYKKTPYPELNERQKDLALLKQAVLDYQDEIIVAMNDDFGCRSSDDTKLGDVLATIMGINYASKKLKKWMKPSKRHIGILFQPAKAYVMYQPLGVVGIVTPWNYPLFLSIGPLTLALAAGNRAMIKMSEFTPATNKVINDMITSVFSADKVVVIDGGPQVAAHFTQKPFDHLLFTGSTRVGKMVMAAAAQNLTPVTLELGGKSPTIIADDIDIDDAVSRFILAKTLNAGQTCVAPDYILCPENKIDELVTSCKKQFNRMYPKFADNNDYSSIINEQQFQRLHTWLDDAVNKGATAISLSEFNAEQTTQPRKMPLTLVTHVNDDMKLMQDEIFGPLLPIVSYKSLSEAINYINERPRPLALYLCSHNEQTQQQVLQQTHAGGVCINDAAIQVAQDDMPFGGIGPSGMGHYHGHEGFLTFSKAKSVMIKGKMNTSKMAFPPYGKLVHKLIYKLFLR